MKPEIVPDDYRSRLKSLWRWRPRFFGALALGVVCLRP